MISWIKRLWTIFVKKIYFLAKGINLCVFKEIKKKPLSIIREGLRANLLYTSLTIAPETVKTSNNHNFFSATAHNWKAKI